jgi:hypothetical protein
MMFYPMASLGWVFGWFLVPGRLLGRSDGPFMNTWWLVLMSLSRSDSVI